MTRRPVTRATLCLHVAAYRSTIHLPDIPSQCEQTVAGCSRSSMCGLPSELLCSSHGHFWASVYLHTWQLPQGHSEGQRDLAPVGQAVVDGSSGMSSLHTSPPPCLVARRPAGGSRVSFGPSHRSAVALLEALFGSEAIEISNFERVETTEVYSTLPHRLYRVHPKWARLVPLCDRQC